MLDYVKVKGENEDWRDAIKSTDIQGFLIASLPPITRAKKRYLVEEIDGRDGDSVTELGYSAYDKPLGIGMYGNYDFQNILDYFKERGQIIFSNEPDKYYEYEIVHDINLERVIAFKKGVVNLHVQPFKYSSVDRAKTLNLMLMSMRDYKATANGVTVTIKKDKLTINGTASSLAEFYVPINEVTVTSGTYKLIFDGTGTGADSVDVGIIQNTTSTIFGGSLMKINTNRTITVSEDAMYNFLYIKVPNGTNTNITVEPYVEQTNTEMIVHNIGNIHSAPIITLYGSGNMTLNINGQTVFTINLPNQYDFITLDGRRKNAYNGDVLLNRSIVGDFKNLRLEKGVNTISWTGDVKQVYIDEYSRWI